ncbi:MAG: DNA polymerase III subunit gamma/tau [Planctomycetota bacterium]
MKGTGSVSPSEPKPYLVLARKHRPRRFEEVLGQETVGKTLANALRQNRVAHAYLFSGPRGVGKTSMARILAKALNCPSAKDGAACNACDTCRLVDEGNDTDVQEIDGASNRGIDEVRDIRERAQYTPARGRFRIYIIDEVHMLTGPAFNALLKTLEEPPSHVKFIFATTKPSQLPDTILSRCQRHDFRRVGSATITAHLERICKQEKIKADRDALLLIARRAAGGMRDALSLLDQMATYRPEGIAGKDVREVTGTLDDGTLAELLSLAAEGREEDILRKLTALRDGGIEEDALFDQSALFLRDLVAWEICGGKEPPIDSGEERLALLAALAPRFPVARALAAIPLLEEMKKHLAHTAYPHLVGELAFLRMARGDRVESLVPAPAGEKSPGVPARSAMPVAPAPAARPAPPPPPREPAPAVPPAQRETPVVVKSPPPAPEKAPDEPSPLPAAAPGDVWANLIEAVKTKSRMLAAFLIEGKPAGEKNGKFIIRFSKDHLFHKTQLEAPERRSVVEECLATAAGKRLSLAIETETSSAPEAAPTRADAPPPADESHDALPGDVRAAVEIFRGRIVTPPPQTKPPPPPAEPGVRKQPPPPRDAIRRNRFGRKGRAPGKGGKE